MKTHIASLMDKTGSPNRVHLAVLAAARHWHCPMRTLRQPVRAVRHGVTVD